MCPTCHLIWGLGYGEDDLIIYVRQMNRYFELKGRHFLDIEDIRETVLHFTKHAPSAAEEWRIILQGETIIQLMKINEAIRENTSYLKALHEKMSPPPAPPSTIPVDPIIIFDDKDPRSNVE